MERVISDECLEEIKRQCYEAGRVGRERFTVREPDGEEVVRCRDCVHSDADGCTLLDFSATDWDGNGYCAWGHRKEGA